MMISNWNHPLVSMFYTKMFQRCNQLTKHYDQYNGQQRHEELHCDDYKQYSAKSKGGNYLLKSKELLPSASARQYWRAGAEGGSSLLVK